MWFFAPESVQKEMLATALAAMTTGLRVYVYLDSDSMPPAEYTGLQCLYLISE
jgi:hypothetical protein